MPVNRFDQPIGQRYTSTYVPMPLEEIGHMAKQYSDQYKLGQALPQQLDVLGQAIKAAPVDFENKQIILNEYKGKLNDLVNNAKPEDYARPEYQQKVGAVINQFKNDPRLNAIINNKEVFDKVYTPYLNSKESKKDLVLTNVLSQDHPTGYKQMKQGESLAPLDYIQHEDALKGAKTIMDDIKIDGTPLSSISKWKRDGNYFIDQDGHRKEITPDKVMNIAKANVGNFAENSEGRFRFKSLLNQLGLDPHMSYSEFKYNDTIDKKVKSAVDNELANDLYNYGSKQIFKDTDISYNLEADQLAMHAGKKKIDEAPTPGLLQTIEGAPIPLVTPEFKGLYNDGIINDKGEVNWGEVAKTTTGPGTKEAGDRTAKIGGWINLDMGETGTKKSYTNAEKLANVVIQAAKILNIPANEIKADNYNSILKQYNEFVTAKGYMGNQYTGADKDIITKQVKTDPSNYEFLDDKLQVSDDAQDIKKSMFDSKTNLFTVNSRVNIDGKSYLQATVTDKESGETKEVYIRPKTKEFNQHFDNVAKVAESMKDYYTGKEAPYKAEDPRFKGAEVIAQTITNSGNNVITVYRDPSNPDGKEIIVSYNVTKTKDGAHLSNPEILANSFKEYQQGEHYKYGFTNEGHKMYENVAPSKTKYEANTEE